jgi:hypothetical protein
MSVRKSIENLRTFPYIREREEDGRLTLHGAWFDISEGVLWIYDPDKDAFEPAIGTGGLAGEGWLNRLPFVARNAGTRLQNRGKDRPCRHTPDDRPLHSLQSGDCRAVRRFRLRSTGDGDLVVTMISGGVWSMISATR